MAGKIKKSGFRFAKRWITKLFEPPAMLEMARKKLRAHLGKLYPLLSEETLGDLVPSKDEMNIVKIYTNSGDGGLVYCLQKNPIFFEIQDRLFPTVYTLWCFPELLPVFTTWPPVFTRLAGGADLMLPGVVVRGQCTTDSLGNVRKGEVCAVKLVGNRAPVAVGTTLMSAVDMVGSGMKGKGLRVWHMFGDELWSFGDKSEPPILEDLELSDASEIENKLSVENADEIDIENTNGTGASNGGESLPPMEGLALNSQSETISAQNDGIEGAVGGDTEMPGSEVSEIDTESCMITTEEMDELLYEAFMTALKTKVNKSDLPLLTSHFYRNCMLPCSTRRNILDIKKSSHKKLSKFLQKMSKLGLIKVKELSKGVESITEVDRTAPELRTYVPAEISEQEQSTEGEESNKSGFSPPAIVEMYSVTAPLANIFKPYQYSKGSALSACDVRKVITEYVKANNLQVPDKKGVVQLDPILADVVLAKGEVNITHLPWEQLLSRFLQKMQIVYQVTFAGQPPVIRKGKIEPISIDVVQRASNKKATLVDNLEFYGIDPVEFAHRVQVGVACSASANPMPQKNKGLQVLVQGNQIHYIADLLLGEYQIQRKYIKGLEKAPKSGKKR